MQDTVANNTLPKNKFQYKTKQHFLLRNVKNAGRSRKFFLQINTVPVLQFFANLYEESLFAEGNTVESLLFLLLFSFLFLSRDYDCTSN